MKRILSLLALLAVAVLSVEAHVALPDEQGTKQALSFDHFPHPQYTFVWRNWSVVPKQKLATTLGTTVERVEQLAMQMGLPRKQHIEKDWLTHRGYITIVRRNWHLLTYDQLLALVGMSREEFKFRLGEDDFLYVKLGNLKPQCAPLQYVEPTADMVQRATAIARETRGLGRELFEAKEPRFDFMHEFDTLQGTAQSVKSEDGAFELKIVYPHFADFGDPLLDKNLTTYPEELFRRLAQVGVNGIWMHVVMRTLVEPDDKGFPGDVNAAERLAGLQRIVDRAAKYGVKVFLYLNEPRGMEPAFFDTPQRRSYGGTINLGVQAFCPSSPEVLDWLSRSTESIFTRVKGLGGVFTITLSENYTTCVSRLNTRERCPRCRNHSWSKLQADVCSAIERGVHRADRDAKVIIWDWKWPAEQCADVIRRLPKECWYMSVSEWELPIERGGVKSPVREYSMSSIGPSQYAKDNWRVAREAGLKTMAKVQVNSSWEMAIAPSIPVLDLVAQHAENLSKEHVNGLFLSWSLGGSPTENLKLFQNFDGKTSASEAVERLALSEYGPRAGVLVREAWRECSEGFKEYPYHIGTIYNGPHHVGPANLFYTKPTGYRATMVGIPYDDYKRWRSVYPIDVWYTQHDKAAAGFDRGVALLKRAMKVARGVERERVAVQLSRAEAICLHLHASAEQERFFEARDNYAKATTDNERHKYAEIMRRACLAERELILRMLPILSRDSEIAYEASNHYFYLPCDLGEALLSVNYALRWLEGK